MCVALSFSSMASDSDSLSESTLSSRVDDLYSGGSFAGSDSQSGEDEGPWRFDPDAPAVSTDSDQSGNQSDSDPETPDDRTGNTQW